jgi:hypothetical protein
MEQSKTRKFQRVIVRSAAGDERLLVSVTSSSKIVKALYNQRPDLSTVFYFYFILFCDCIFSYRAILKIR